MRAKPRSEALGAIHETMQALHQIGAVDRETMNEIEAACLSDALRRHHAMASASLTRLACMCGCRLPHAIAVTTAEVTDRKGALQALQRCKPRLNKVQSLLCDSGYVGQPFAQGVTGILGEQVTVQIAKRSELHTFKVMPKRWVVERSFAWLEKNRRLWKNCERHLNTSLQFIHLAFLALLLKRF
jgi:transposase